MLVTRLLLTTLLFGFSFSSVAFGGAWTRKQGSGFVQLGFSTIGYNKIYDDNGEKAPVFANVRDNVLQLYADYGILDQLTATAAVPFKFVSVNPTSSLAPVAAKSTNSGIGDIDLMLRYSWFNVSGYVFSNEVLFGLPTGDSKNTNGLWLGDGEFNVAMKILGGRSFYPRPIYVTADIGYNIRGSGFSNDILYNMEFGYGLLEGRLYLILLLSGKESTSTVPSQATSPTDLAAAALGFSTNNQEYTAIIPKVVYKFENSMGLAVSFGTATHGRNIAGGFVFAGGVFYEY